MDLYHEPWTAFAVCREVSPDLWHPGKGDDHMTPRLMCLSSCTVRLNCLDYAMRIEQGMGPKLRAGIYGGMSPGQRAKYQTQWLAEQDGSAA